MQITDEVHVDEAVGEAPPPGGAGESVVVAARDDRLQRDDCDGAPGIGVGYITSYAFTIFNPDFPTQRYGLIARNSNTDFQTAAGAFIQPYLKKYDGTKFPLMTFALGEVKLRDIEVSGGDGLRLNARFS